MKGGQIGIVENNSHNQMLWTESVSGPHPQPQSIGWNCNLHDGIWRWGLWDFGGVNGDYGTWWGLGDDEAMRL